MMGDGEKGRGTATCPSSHCESALKCHSRTAFPRSGHRSRAVQGWPLDHRLKATACTSSLPYSPAQPGQTCAVLGVHAVLRLSCACPRHCRTRFSLSHLAPRAHSQACHVASTGPPTSPLPCHSHRPRDELVESTHPTAPTLVSLLKTCAITTRYDAVNKGGCVWVARLDSK